ncbi:MAG: zinc ribbon domain-containing protein [Candidatus Heimdallarchaeota archaeon]
MSFCSKCGVEIEPHKTHCPLCGSPIQETDEEPVEYTKKYPDEPALGPSKPGRTAKQRRKLIWEIASVTLIIPLLITLFTDLIINKTVSWSLYSIASLILVWLIISMPLLFPDKLTILLIGEALPLFVFLLVIDLIDNGRIDWYLRVGLPMVALVETIIIAVVITSISVKNKGLNIASFILFGIGVICLGVDFIISSFLKQRFTVSWSLYVLASTLVIGGFLLYLHFRIIRGVDLKRKLNI